MLKSHFTFLVCGTEFHLPKRLHWKDDRMEITLPPLTLPYQFMRFLCKFVHPSIHLSFLLSIHPSKAYLLRLSITKNYICWFYLWYGALTQALTMFSRQKESGAQYGKY